MTKRILNLFIILVMVISLIGLLPSVSVWAANGNDLSNKAKSYVGRTGSSFGWTFNWCARFVWYCAEQCGISSNVIPHTDSSTTMYNNLVNNLGGKIVSSPQAGDLAFYDYTLNDGKFDHVGIMTGSVSSVQGNMGSGNNRGSAIVKSLSSSYASLVKPAGLVKKTVYIRPNYGGSVSAPTFGTPYTTSVGEKSAYIKCSISKNGSNWSQVGAYYGTSTSSMVKAGSDNLGSGNTWAGYTLSNLKSGTTYYYKFYITANGTTYYSSIQSFKTTGGVSSPIWNSVTSYDIGNTTATIKATFTRNGSSFEKYKVYFGKSSSSLSEVSSGTLTSGATWIRSIFTNLSQGTTYYYRFCIIANGGISYYSSIQSFKTTGNTPHTHLYTSTVVDPTCTSQGYILHKCSCGTSYKDQYTSATGHKYSNGVCKVCGAKDPNYIEPTKRSPYLEFSDKTITLNVNETKTIDVSAKGDLPKISVKYICDSKKVSCSWSKKWSNHSTQINIKGVKAGVHEVRIELYNSNTKELLSTNTIQVIVKNPTSPFIYTVKKLTTKEVTNLGKVKAVKIKANKKRLNVSWKKVSGATGYEVKFSFKTKYITIDWSSKFTKKKSYKCKIKHWANGERVKKYMFKVRAFKKVNGYTYYGNWSKVVKKKTK